MQHLTYAMPQFSAKIPGVVTPNYH